MGELEMTDPGETLNALSRRWANEQSLQNELARPRLLLERRILRLRGQADDGARLEAQAVASEQARRDIVAAAPVPETGERGLRISGFERDLLLLCLAPEIETEIDPAFAALIAQAQEDGTRRPTLHLALALFAENDAERRAIREALAADGPLRRYRLLVVESGPPLLHAPLTLDERIVSYLRGVNCLDAELAAALNLHEAGVLPQTFEPLIDWLGQAIEARRRQGEPVTVNLVGPSDSGQAEVAAAICARLGIRLYDLDAAHLPAHDGQARLQREGVLLAAGAYVDAEDDTDSLTGQSRLLREVARGGSLPLFVSSERPWQELPGAVVVEMPRLSAVDRAAVWARTLSAEQSAINGAAPVEQSIGAEMRRLGTLAQQFELGPGAIRRVAARLRDEMSRAAVEPEANRERIEFDTLWALCREQAAWKLTGWGRRIEPSVSWGDLVVPGQVMEQLQEIAAQVAFRHQVYDEWGYGSALREERGIGALFVGPSGTGKSMAAEILAGHLRLALFRIDLAAILDRSPGETERTLAKLLDAAQGSGAILLFDEADALFARGEGGYWLRRLEAYRGLCIVESREMPTDVETLRRLRFVIPFEMPDAESRRRLWMRAFPRAAPVEALDYKQLARLELTGGSIRAIAVNAAFLAAEEQARLGMAHLMRAARREYAKLGKTITEEEFSGG